MRRTIPLLALLATLAAVSFSAPTEAAADRYCLQGRQWGYPGNCQFATRQQCMASASGTHASCGVNPRYAHSRSR